MKELYSKCIDAKLYIDEWSDEIVKVTDKVRIYDSRQKYITYFETDYIIDRAEENKVSPEEYLQYLAIRMSEALSAEDLLDKVLRLQSYCFESSEHIDWLFEDFIGLRESDDEINKEIAALSTYGEKLEWLDNAQGVNFLGNYLLIVFEE